MDATAGSDGGGLFAWSYRDRDREQIAGISSSNSYTIGSSSSGTASPGYASTNGSHLSWISMEAAMAMNLEEMEKSTDSEVSQPVNKRSRKETEKKGTDDVPSTKEEETAKEKKMKHIKSLAKEFFGAPSAASDCSGADMSVVERWLSELGVGWVLHLPFADGDGAPQVKILDARSWIQAVTEIMDAFWCLRTTPSLFPAGHGSVEERYDNMKMKTEQLQITGFTQEAMLRILTFVDILIAPNNFARGVFTFNLMPAPYQMIHALLHVRNALSKALSVFTILSKFHSSPSAEVARMEDEMVSVLSAKEVKTGEAVWSAVQELRARMLESAEDSQDYCSSGCTQTPQGSSSSDIDKATRSVINYAMFLEGNYMSVNAIVSQAAELGNYKILEIEDALPPLSNLVLTNLVLEMTSCVQEKLVNKSEKLEDQSLRFLFLLNNSYFIGDQLRCTIYFRESYDAALTANVEGYMDSYIQSSWAPVLACLFDDPTPGCFGKNSSPLPKFESEFHKTFMTQKLWKVPDPRLRKKLRKAITDKIISGYTKYIHDNNVTTSRLTPQELEDMLQELFEG